MITREELNRIAKKNRLGLYQQEKEYLLKMWLYLYYRRYDDAVFKGGTCLKFAYGLNRFSEDLDFNVRNSKVLQKQVSAVLKDFESHGIRAYFLKEEMFDDSYTCEIGFEGPLYTGKKHTQNRIRIDAGYRTGTFEPAEWRMVQNEYTGFEKGFLILSMSLKEILAEKVIAMLNRDKGRDLYDIWYLLQLGVGLDAKLLEKKAQKENVELHKKVTSKAVYEKDLKRLMARVPPYEQVKKEVFSKLSSDSIF